MQCMLLGFTVHEHYQVRHIYIYIYMYIYIYIYIYTQSAHMYLHTVCNVYAAAGGMHAWKVEEKREVEEVEAPPDQESRTERRGRP